MNLRFVRNLRLLPLLAAFPVLAADGLDVKTGTWETTVTMKTSGMDMPADAVAYLTPQQKAQMEAVKKQFGASAPRTFTEKSCVTEKDLREGAFRLRAGNNEVNCTSTPVVSTATRQETTFKCPSKGGETSGHMIVNAADSSNVNGEMQFNGVGITMETSFRSKWLGAACAAENKTEKRN